MNTWKFKLLYDGECPICRAEVRWLSRWNREKRLAFEDIKEEGFDPRSYGKSMDDLMGALHGVFPDGTLVAGTDAFREAYKALGLGWLMSPTGWPGIKHVTDWAYSVFARNRIKLGTWFGKAGSACNTGNCRIPGQPMPHIKANNIVGTDSAKGEEI